MSKEEDYNHASITQEGQLVEGENKPKDWAFHYYTVQDDRQWANFTYKFEARINPDISFEEARQAISKARRNDQESNEKILKFLEAMVLHEKRSAMDSLFAVK